MNVEEIFSENKNFGSEENGEIPNLSSLRFIFWKRHTWAAYSRKSHELKAQTSPLPPRMVQYI